MGPAFVTQGAPGEQDVLGGDRRAVLKSGVRVDVEGDPRPVVGDLDGLGDQRVKRERLILAALHEALEDQAQPLRRHAQNDVGVQVVKGAEGCHPQHAANRRTRVGVGEVRHARWISGIAMHRQSGLHLTGR